MSDDLDALRQELAAAKALQERTAKDLQLAIDARDKAKADARLAKDERAELEELRTKASAAEDERLKADGNYQALEAKLQGELAAAREETTKANQRYAQQVTRAAFQAATGLFGPQGLTTLPPDVAYAYFSNHVSYTPGDNGRDGRLVVTSPTGDPIQAEDGQPLAFADAMGKLIEGWPSKDTILRAPGRTGSGSTGDASDLPARPPTDRAALVANAAAGDKQALAELRRTQPSNVVAGPHWERARDGS